MNPSILYIEDEEDYQILVRRILQRAGFELRVASTGADGLTLLREQRPSLLLLDINLPDTDGYAICQQLRQDGAYDDLPVLMLTVRRRPEEWLKGFSCGANDYLSKPFDPAGLTERIQSGLAGKTLHSSNAKTPEYLLIRSAVAGNRAAFEVLIHKYRERLISSLRISARAGSEAEDIASHAFLRAFECLSDFRGEASFYTWLYRIALNEASERRSPDASIETLTQGDESALPPSLTQTDSIERELLEAENSEKIKNVLSRVPLLYRQMLELFFLNSLSYEDISKKLDIPMGTVMSRLHKAREMLKAAWTEAAPTR